MSGPSNFEQAVLELVNRARLDPLGEYDALIVDVATQTAVTPDITFALQYFNVDLAVFQAQLASTTPVAPVAWNADLAAAATAHSQAMIVADSQSHQLPGELSIGERIRAEGYDYRYYSENIFAYGRDPVYVHAGFYIDWGSGTATGIQDPPGHRINILNATATEVGISAIAETDPATTVGPQVVTQNFGTRGDYRPQLVGVVIDDADGDAAYDMGEGLGGIEITATSGSISYTTTSWGSGGYQMVLPAGTYSLSFVDSQLGVIDTGTVTIGSENVKFDGILELNHPIAGTAGDDRLVGTSGDDVLQGFAGDDTLRGDGGADTLWSGDGDDLAYGGTGGDLIGAGIGNDTVWAGSDNDVLYGGSGDDVLGGGPGDDEIWAGSGNDSVYGSDDADQIGGGAGDDELWAGSGDDVVYGGSGGDRLGGGIGNDALWGGDEADSLYGSTGDDELGGGDGDDDLWGGDGSDTLRGGTGNDTLGGGTGADRIVFADGSGQDRVVGFVDDVDTLALDDDLWAGTLSTWQVIGSFATVVGGDTVFDFGGGDVLELAGIADPSVLSDDIDFI